MFLKKISNILHKSKIFGDTKLESGSRGDLIVFPEIKFSLSALFVEYEGLPIANISCGDSCNFDILQLYHMYTIYRNSDIFD